MISYHELRSISPKKAREVIQNVLSKHGGNVSKTARSLKICTETVRRARNGPAADGSTKPLHSPKRTESFLETLIVKEGKETGYRYRRLAKFLWCKYSYVVSEDTVRAILRRNQVKGKTIRTRNKRSRPLYDYEALEPFAELQMDTKHVLDANALPDEVYKHILKHNLPRYEWNIIDVKTKARFTAYSHELSTTHGWMFQMLVLSWLRAHNVRTHIRVQADNGAENCSGSRRKEEKLNELLKPFGAHFESIPAGKKYLQGVVENSHRHDDEQFLSIHPLRCKTDDEFIQKAQRWQDTWNTARPSWGHGMKGRTPKEKLAQGQSLINLNVLHFPTLNLDAILNSTGRYVPTNYP